MYCTFYVQTGETFDLAPVLPTFLYGNLSSIIGDFQDGTPFVTQLSVLKVGKTTIVVLAATSPGKAKMDVGFVFPITLMPKPVGAK